MTKSKYTLSKKPNIKFLTNGLTTREVLKESLSIEGEEFVPSSHIEKRITLQQFIDSKSK